YLTFAVHNGTHDGVTNHTVDVMSLLGNGNAVFSNTVTAALFAGTGADITNLDASNISTGTLADTHLSANVSLLGSSIQDAEVDNNLTISSSGNVAWTALSGYPTGCSAG